MRVNKSWNSGYFLSSKTPTSILLNPDQSFLAFGYDAEYIYSILAENEFCDDEEQITKEKRNQYYFFQRFKEILHKQVSSIFDITMKLPQIFKQMFMFLCPSISPSVKRTWSRFWFNYIFLFF